MRSNVLTLLRRVALWVPGPELSLIFLELALPGVFTDCYRKDEERAQKLLTRVSEAWGKTTCLQLALEAKNMNFVSHGGVQVGSQQWSLEGMFPSVSKIQSSSGVAMGLCPVRSTPLSPSSQAFLTKVWWGKLSVDNGLWRVITCMLFFPLLYTNLITFRYFWQLGHPCTEAGFSSSLTLWLAGGSCRGLSWAAKPTHPSLPPAGRRGCSPWAAWHASGPSSQPPSSSSS